MSYTRIDSRIQGLQILQRELVLDEVSRRYLMVVPENGVENARPLVVLFHDSGSSPEALLGIENEGFLPSPWLELARRENLMLAVPAGMPDAVGQTSWAQDWEQSHYFRRMRDEVLVSAILNQVVEHFLADEVHIYLIGIGCGGTLAYRLTYTSGAQLAAVATIGAAIPNARDDEKPWALPLFVATSPVPTLDSLGPSNALDAWFDVCELSKESPIHTSHFDQSTEKVWASNETWGADPAKVQITKLSLVNEGGHQDASLVEAIWQFFRSKFRGMAMHSPDKAANLVQMSIDMHVGMSGGLIARDILSVVATSHPPADFIDILPMDVRVALYVCTLHPPTSQDDFHVVESANYTQAFYVGLTESQVTKKLERIRRQRSRSLFDAYQAVHAYFHTNPLSQHEMEEASAQLRVAEVGSYEAPERQIGPDFYRFGCDPDWLELRATASTRLNPIPGNGHSRLNRDIDMIELFATHGKIRVSAGLEKVDVDPSATNISRLFPPLARIQNRHIAQALSDGLDGEAFPVEAASDAFWAGYTQLRLALTYTDTHDCQPHMDTVGLVVLGFLAGHAEEALRVAHRMLLVHRASPLGGDLGKLDPLSYFALRVLSNAFDAPMGIENSAFPLCRFYDHLSANWATADIKLLQHLCLVACDLHTSLYKVEPTWSPEKYWAYLPVEILLLLQLRSMHGRELPSFDHPLMRSVMCQLRHRQAPIHESLMTRLRDRVRSDGQDEDDLFSRY